MRNENQQSCRSLACVSGQIKGISHVSVCTHRTPVKTKDRTQLDPAAMWNVKRRARRKEFLHFAPRKKNVTRHRNEWKERKKRKKLLSESEAPKHVLIVQIFSPPQSMAWTPTRNEIVLVSCWSCDVGEKFDVIRGGKKGKFQCPNGKRKVVGGEREDKHWRLLRERGDDEGFLGDSVIKFDCLRQRLVKWENLIMVSEFWGLEDKII